MRSVPGRAEGNRCAFLSSPLLSYSHSRLLPAPHMQWPDSMVREVGACEALQYRIFYIWGGKRLSVGKKGNKCFLIFLLCIYFFCTGKKKKKGPNSLKNSKYQRREDKVSYPILQIRIWNTCRYFFFLKKSSQIPNRIGSFCVWGSPLLKPCAHITGLNRGTVATQQK